MRNRTATRFVIAALAVTLVAAGAIATASSRAVGGQRTIALVTLAQSPDSHELARGAREAAAALGGRFVLEAVGDAAVRRTIAGLVAARVAAIAVEPPFTSASLASLLEQARKAGIATLSVEQPVAAAAASGSTRPSGRRSLPMRSWTLSPRRSTAGATTRSSARSTRTRSLPSGRASSSGTPRGHTRG